MESPTLPPTAAQHSAIAVEIGAVLRAQRERLGLTLEDTAVKANFDASHLRYIEDGVYGEHATPHIHVVQRIADVLGLRLTLAAQGR